MERAVVVVFHDPGALAVSPVDVKTRSRAVELIESDPYYVACPRNYRLLAWGKALPHVQVLM